MSLRDLPVGPVIPVSDLAASLAFDEGLFGLSGGAVPGGHDLLCGGDTRVFLLAGTHDAGLAEWPLASFQTDRLDAIVDGLAAHGVQTEKLPGGEFETDGRGSASLDGLHIAWIRDPDDQAISIYEPAT